MFLQCLPGISIVLLVVGILCMYRWFCRRKKRECISVDKEKEVKTLSGRKRAMQVRIRVIYGERQQINIFCYKLDEEKQIGELLASIQKEEVHLEQILVSRHYRKKGVGKLMFSYLLKEMRRIEQQMGVDFRRIYGEIGQGGTDDPRVSLPFYQHMDGAPYGEKKLSLRINKGAALDGLDQFIYYIVEKS